MNPKPTNKQRILIVDDEPDGARSLALLLKIRGFQTDVVIDSRETLARLDSFRPDAILLDLAMPEVSGCELARQIRAQRRFDPIAILAVSGYADTYHASLSLESGCDHHLAKPVDLAMLEQCLLGCSNNAHKSVYMKSTQVMGAHAMNPSYLDSGIQRSPKMENHERAAVRNRQRQIGVALGHPRLTIEQTAALMREKLELERIIAAMDCDEVAEC